MILAELVITAALVGLIWTIQIVHYPSFRFVDRDTFNIFHRYHSNSITFIVAPLMVAELILSIINFKTWLPIILVAIIWLTTALVSVPIHNRLSTSKNESQINRLILTNWLRTIAWSVRLGLLINLAGTRL